MNEQFYDLKTERLPDGTVQLTQTDNSGNEYIINAHPAQIIHIGRSLVGARVSPEAERIKTLERRLRWLRDRFSEAFAELPSEFYDNCYTPLEFDAWLHASCDVATEYCADLTPEASTKELSPG